MMVNDLLPKQEDRTVLRGGGLAGVLGSVVILVVFAIVAVFVGTFAGPEAEVAAYPDVQVARTVENGLYLVALVAWAVSFAGLYRALRATSPASALYGAVLGIVSMVVLAAGALPHVVTSTISDLYHAAGTTPAERADLVVAWQASQSVINSLLVVGLVIAPLAVLLLGVAMVRTPAFGTRLGRGVVGLGVAGAAAAVVLVAVPGSPVGVVGILVLVVFHLVVGWRLLRLPARGSDGS
ncbi:hypothetical protein [Pengzhenrongella phosphoraccumulans]|uniref:hypothetical protein n=1 Tax=Pengzhenrongella phosphoraccumulans TaxID=3114394 RepID=UPI00388E5309